MATQPVQLHPDDLELQQEGQQAAAQNAPAPLQNATRDLNVQYRNAPQDTDSAVAAPAGYKMVAGVEHGNPRAVDINDKPTLDAHADQVIPHELYHVWSNNLSPEEQARIPKSKSADDYKEPTVEDVTAMRAKGTKLLDVPNEKAAQMMAWAGRHPNDPKIQAAMKPYLDDMRGQSLSTIDATAPTDKNIATHPRAPMGPRDDIPGMEELSGKPPQPGAKPGKALNAYPNPEDRPPDESLKFNQSWAKPGPYQTKLSPEDEAAFRTWAKANPKAVDGELDNPKADYDVRGHWLAAKNHDPEAALSLNKWDGKMHGSDKFKTPYNGGFSNESMYATPEAPRWNGNKLVTKDGQLVTDETPKHFVQRGKASKLTPELAEQYIVKAKGNKAVAREMAKHDNHTF
jgi:hypothetical protein